MMWVLVLLILWAPGHGLVGLIVALVLTLMAVWACFVVKSHCFLVLPRRLKCC